MALIIDYMNSRLFEFHHIIDSSGRPTARILLQPGETIQQDTNTMQRSSQQTLRTSRWVMLATTLLGKNNLILWSRPLISIRNQWLGFPSVRLQELAQRPLEDEETPDRIFAIDRDIFQEPLNLTQTGMSLELDSRSISEKRNNQALCPRICTFFNLPGEIRNLIYSHLLAANYIGLRLIDPRPDSGVTEVKKQKGRSERTNILLASRRAHHEALPFLYRENRFGVLIDLRCLAARSLSNTAINMMQNIHIVIDLRIFGTGAIESQSEEPSYKMRILNHLGGLHFLNIKRKSCRITLRISDFEC